MKAKVVINADDFGKDENATMAIAESFRRGFITQTTLMVNMPWAEKAVELARKEGFADKVGLHLNLTEGRPLTEGIAKCDVFCAGNGEFRGRHSTSDELSRRDVRQAFKGEVQAQVFKYVSYGLPLMHCDGHHHVQSKIHVAKILMPILRDNCFKSIRRPYNVWVNPLSPHIRSRIQQLLFRMLAVRNRLSTSDYFTGWGEIALCERLFKRNCRLELMVHPRYDAQGNLIDVTDFANCKGRLMKEISGYDC